MACGSRAAMACKREAMSSKASSQPTRSKRPDPLGPTRRKGCSKRSGWWVRSAYRDTLVHNTPAVWGWSGLPYTRNATPPLTVVSREQVSGQSCGQAPSTVWVAPGWLVVATVFMGPLSSKWEAKGLAWGDEDPRRHFGHSPHDRVAAARHPRPPRTVF